jgi:hypothetical protein
MKPPQWTFAIRTVGPKITYLIANGKGGASTGVRRVVIKTSMHLRPGLRSLTALHWAWSMHHLAVIFGGVAADASRTPPLSATVSA